MYYQGYYIDTKKQYYADYGIGYGIFFAEGCYAAITVFDTISEAKACINSGCIKKYH